MFTSEHLGLKNNLERRKRSVFVSGMPLADGHHVSKAINHKTIVIAAGILVALVIMITFWLEHEAANTSQVYNIHLPKVSAPATTKLIQETLQKVLF